MRHLAFKWAALWAHWPTDYLSLSLSLLSTIYSSHTLCSLLRHFGKSSLTSASKSNNNKSSKRIKCYEKANEAAKTHTHTHTHTDKLKHKSHTQIHTHKQSQTSKAAGAARTLCYKFYELASSSSSSTYICMCVCVSVSVCVCVGS